MTGLANRRVFDEQLQEWLVAWHRDQVPVSILLFDVDHFRGFNNDYGHQAGDAVLTQVAHALKRSMGENDLVSRIGGEEFVVIIDRDSRRRHRHSQNAHVEKSSKPDLASRINNCVSR